MRQQLGVAPVNSPDAVRFVDLAVQSFLQSAIPFVQGPSAYMQNNGVVIIGQRPSSSATATFSATSGTGVTCTFSAATLSGGSTTIDNGRVFTILDTTYKFFTVTGNSGSSTTVCQGTISGGTLSSVGPFANSALWETAASTANGSFSNFLPRVVGNSYSYFPANAIQSGSAAGWYWTNWSSSTVGQVYNNAYSSGTPPFQSSPTAFVSTGPGAFTQTAGTYIQARSKTLLGNALGINGSIEASVLLTMPISGNAKTWKGFYGGIANRFGQVQSTAFGASGAVASLSNQGIATSQIYTIGNSGNGDFTGAASASVALLAVDSTQAQTLGDTINLGVNTDYIILERLSIKLFPSSP